MDEKKVCNNCNGHEEHVESWAFDLLKDYKKQCRNWFIAFLVVVSLWFITICGFVWYLNQYDFSSYTIEQSTADGGDANYIGNDGDIYNGLSESNRAQAN